MALRSEEEFPLKEYTFISDIYERLWTDGYFDDYSEEHILIRLLHKDDEAFSKFISKLRTYTVDYPNNGKIDHFTFLINFSTRLNKLVDWFGYDEIAQFVSNELSAGKKNYNEQQFFEAYSEVLILTFFGTFGPNCVSAVYEPTTGEGKSNPEASFEFEDGTHLEIEVKRARMQSCFSSNDSVMPLRCMSLDGIKKFERECRNKGISCVRPRVGKLKDYINMSCKKFSPIKSEKHYNILVINWSTSEIKFKPCLEPAMILMNPENGVLNHKGMEVNYEISSDLYDKITAIFVIHNSVESIAYTDMRYLFASRDAYMLLNPYLLDTEAKKKDFMSTFQMGERDFQLDMDAVIYFDSDKELHPVTKYQLTKCVNDNKLIL